MVYTVPYSKGKLTFELPKGMTGTLVESKRVPPIEDVEKEVAAEEAELTKLEVDMKGAAKEAMAAAGEASDASSWMQDPDAPNPQETLTENAADATVKGFELEVVAIPVTGLQLNLAVGYNDAGYEEFFADINGDGTVTDNSDIPLQRAPEWTIGAGLSYDAQLGNMGTAVFTADFSHVAKQNNLASGVPKGEIGSYELLDMSVTWRAPSERYYATFYVKNVTDEVYQASITAVGALFDTNLISAPRRWGLTVGFDL